MRRYVFIILISLVLPVVISTAEPHKPYPIIFIHGVGATSEGCWGAGVDTLADGEKLSDWVTSWESTYAHFLDYMTKYAWAWYDWGDDTYTPDPDDPELPPQVRARFPNKTFLEVINFNDNRRSIDPHSGYLEPYPV